MSLSPLCPRWRIKLYYLFMYLLIFIYLFLFTYFYLLIFIYLFLFTYLLAPYSYRLVGYFYLVVTV